jgi:hypothetical protein
VLTDLDIPLTSYLVYFHYMLLNPQMFRFYKIIFRDVPYYSQHITSNRQFSNSLTKNHNQTAELCLIDTKTEYEAAT